MSADNAHHGDAARQSQQQQQQGQQQQQDGATGATASNRLRTWSSGARRAAESGDASGASSSEALSHGQRTDGALLEADQAKESAMEAALEANAYDKLISAAPAMTRDIMKDLVLEKYAQDMDGAHAVDESAAADAATVAAARDAESSLQRTLSHPDLGQVLYPSVPAPSEINVPGGFRRDYLVTELEAEGEQGVPEVLQTSFLESLIANNSALLYAWVEDGLLSDSSDDSDSDLGSSGASEAGSSSGGDDEEAALFADGDSGARRSGRVARSRVAAGGSFSGRLRARRPRRQMVFSSYGARSLARRNSDYQNDESIKSGNRKTVLTLFKCFVATGVLFLPGGFRNAGLVAGAVTLLCVGAASLAGMLLLMRTRAHVEAGNMNADDAPTPATPLLSSAAAAGVSRALFPRRRPAGGSGASVVGTYSQLGGRVMGRAGRRLVETSILCSQIGFCCVYVSFIGNTLSQAAEEGRSPPPASGGAPNLPLWAYMVMAVPVIVPLTLIRHLKHFAVPNLVANAFVAASLLYIMAQAVADVAAHAHEPDWSCDAADLVHTACFWLNSRSYAVFLGSSVYVFEGITMVIPIQNAMRHSEDLPGMLRLVLTAVTLLFCLFGSLCFFAYAEDTRPIVLDNLPRNGKLAVTAMFVVVAVFMFPLMAFPAARIIEKRLFKKQRRSGFKWQKNLIRTGIVLLCLAVSVGAGDAVDKLVAVIGGMFCVPLALVYPPLLFLRSGAAESLWTEKLPAATLCAVGIVAAVFSSATAIAQF